MLSFCITIFDLCVIICVIRNKIITIVITVFKRKKLIVLLGNRDSYIFLLNLGIYNFFKISKALTKLLKTNTKKRVFN